MNSPYLLYASGLQTTVQTQPIPGREHEMVLNNAGGYGFVLDDWEQLERFLITGSESGTYYVGQKALTEQNAACAIRCIKHDGVRAVRMARSINVANRAPKVDAQLFVLALAMRHGDADTKEAVEVAAPDMLRTGTHLLHLVAMFDGLGGWSRSKRRIISYWFSGRDADKPAFQCVKYQNRDGWAMRDVLRVTHPDAPTDGHRAVYNWLCGRQSDNEPSIIQAYRSAHSETDSAVERALAGLQAGLPREALPTEAMNEPSVIRAMLPSMPLHALLRNLGNMAAAGVLINGADECAIVARKITDQTAIRKARVHPFAVLLATLVYKRCSGVRGSKTWTIANQVLTALEDAYDLAFENVEPTGKRILIGTDISGSMSATCVGSPISASTAAAAMAVTLARSEPNATVAQFDTAVRRILPITKRTGIAGLKATCGGGTDVAAPVLWASGIRARDDWTSWPIPAAEARTQVFDAFVVLTDSETWAGQAHPAQALALYRRDINPSAKLVCCAMAANHANVVDPSDPLSFGCAGLDANLPSLVADFIRGTENRDYAQ